MEKSKIFEREISLIKDPWLQKICRIYFDEYVPSYFWEIGASSSGKYHPQFSQGDGGLVRHTKAVVMFAEELLKMSQWLYMPDIYKDYVILACLVHDTCKYGTTEFDKSCYSQHGELAAALFALSWYDCADGEQAPEFLLSAIRSHMGQWTTEKEHRPFTPIDRCVHMADYMASRSFIDIPQLHDEG